MPEPIICTGALADAKQRADAIELYGHVWRFVPPGIGRARRWGSEWFSMSTPSVVYVGEQLVAHVGQAMCDLQIDGRRQSIAALHAVCVHPNHRGRGFGRLAMQAALTRLDRLGYASVILWSEKIDLYAKFGFRPVDEHVFTCPAPAATPVASRPLDPDNGDDLAVLRRQLAERVPVSTGHAAADDGWHFLIDLGLANPAVGMVRHLPELDAIVVAQRGEAHRSDTLCIYDVIGRDLPSLAEIVGAFPGDAIKTIELHVSPDRLAPHAKPRPHPDNDRLLARGDTLAPADGRPFALSPFSRT